MLNKTFVNKKVRYIQKDLEVLTKVSEFSLEEIVSDYFKMNNIERLLEKIINRAIDINQHIISEKGVGNEKIEGYEDTFIVLAKLGVYPAKFAKEIAPSAGLRNRIVHEYDDLDFEIIYASVKKDLKQYVKYCDYVLNYIKKN